MKTKHVSTITIIIKSIKLILFVTTVIILPATSQTQESIKVDTVFDVFPLKQRLHYFYKFYSQSSDGDESIAFSLTDSGRVSYLILDSTLVNDSTVEWRITEFRDFIRRKIYYSMNGYDSTFFLNDTMHYLLSEKLSGHHELTCSAVIWNFPLIHLRDQIKVPFYRFMDSSNTKLIYHWEHPNGYYVDGTGTDSLSLACLSGFYRRNFHEQWSSGYLHGSATIMVEATQIPSTVKRGNNLQLRTTSMNQNYPNPFNPSTTFIFYLKNSAYASLKIYNLLGKEIATVAQGNFPQGENRFYWTPKNISSGVYFYQLRTKDYQGAKKFLYIK